MSFDRQTVKTVAESMGIEPADLEAILARGESRTYESGDWLFRESMPREWLGIVESGEVEIVRGLHGTSTQLAVLGRGAVIGEGLLLDGGAPHTAGARAGTRGATVLRIPRAALELVRDASPGIYYRIVGRVARRISDRLDQASDRIHLAAREAPRAGGFRVEHDLLGDRELPDDVYYGVQTLRAVENFAISGIKLSQFQTFIRALAFVKKAAALANVELGVVKPERVEAIVAACDEVAAGKLDAHFVVDMIQGGAGTSTNMNANEVIANRALEILGHKKGEFKHLHPNDDVNASQSTNDAYPTAVKLAVILSLRDTLGAMGELKAALAAKAREFSDVLKMGRTQLQDAVPMTLGQEFGAYAVMVGEAARNLSRASEHFHAINMGATAIGTGICSPPGYADLVTRKLAEVSGIPVEKAEDLVEATQDSGEFALVSGALKAAAVQISKICNDLRLLSMGPRCGLAEIRLPAMQPGSSIMPGKVNPVIPEVVSQVCFQIIGHDMTIAMAAEASQLELNMAEPIIAFDLLHGLMMLKNACVTLTARCVTGIQADRDRCRQYVQNSIGLVTALNPVLGYEKSVSIAKEALDTGGSVYDLVLAKGWLTKERLDDLLRPENMVNPRAL